MKKKFVPAYLRALVQAYKAAKRAECDNDAQYIQNIFNNVLYQYAQECSIDEYEEMRPLASQIDSDFYLA